MCSGYHELVVLESRSTTIAESNRILATLVASKNNKRIPAARVRPQAVRASTKCWQREVSTL